MVLNIYFFLRLNGITKEIDNQQRAHFGILKVLVKLKVTGLMIITFRPICNVKSKKRNIEVHRSPIWLQRLKLDHNDLYFDFLGWCCDFIVYILLQKRVSKLVYSMTKRTNKVDNVDTRPDMYIDQFKWQMVVNIYCTSVPINFRLVEDLQESIHILDINA